MAKQTSNDKGLKIINALYCYHIFFKCQHEIWTICRPSNCEILHKSQTVSIDCMFHLIYLGRLMDHVASPELMLNSQQS